MESMTISQKEIELCHSHRSKAISVFLVQTNENFSNQFSKTIQFKEVLFHFGQKTEMN